MPNNHKIQGIFDFMDETIRYFNSRLKGVGRDRYFADRDIRNILDKTLNDIILCMVDIAEQCLRKDGRKIPDTYKDTILACHEFIGEPVLRVAPLVRRRNESIHQYLKVNWQNVMAVKKRTKDIKTFVEKARTLLLPQANSKAKGSSLKKT